MRISKDISRRAFYQVSKWIIDTLALNRPGPIKTKILEQINPIFSIQDGTIKFHCPNETTRWRAETLFTKEPETIDWITSFKQSDIFYDIGGNVGLYAVYAGLQGIRTISFEPESQNFAILNKNVYLNNLQDTVDCFNIALSAKNTVDYLYIPEFGTGTALNNFGAARDWQDNDFTPQFKQRIVSYTVDSFIDTFKVDFPTHIKIDVDGIESQIIAGATKTLQDERVQSLLIEINETSKGDRSLVRKIQGLGFTLAKKAQSDIIKADPKFGKVYNYIFHKHGRVAK